MSAGKDKKNDANRHYSSVTNANSLNSKQVYKIVSIDKKKPLDRCSSMSRFWENTIKQIRRQKFSRNYSYNDDVLLLKLNE